GYGSGRSSTAFTAAKIAALAPMPTAKVMRTIAVKPRFLRRLRRPNRVSCHRPSNGRKRPEARISGGLLLFFELDVRRGRRRRDGCASSAGRVVDHEHLHVELEVLAHERMEEANGDLVVGRLDDLEGDRLTLRALGLEGAARLERLALGKGRARDLGGRLSRLGPERLGGRDDPAFLVADPHPLELLLEAGQHSPGTVLVDDRAALLGGLDALPAFHLELVFEPHLFAPRDQHRLVILIPFCPGLKPPYSIDDGAP